MYICNYLYIYCTFVYICLYVFVKDYQAIKRQYIKARFIIMRLYDGSNHSVFFFKGPLGEIKAAPRPTTVEPTWPEPSRFSKL